MPTAVCASGLCRSDDFIPFCISTPIQCECTSLGVRVAQACGSEAKYFSALDECVPLSIASTQSFQGSILLSSSCPGGEMATQAQIEGTRYCNVIYGGLNITLDDPSADFSAFFDINTLLGLEMDCCVYLVVVTLTCFSCRTSDHQQQQHGVAGCVCTFDNDNTGGK